MGKARDKKGNPGLYGNIVAVALLVRKYNRLKVAKAFYVPPKAEPVQQASAAAEAKPETEKPAQAAEKGAGETQSTTTESEKQKEN